MQSGEELEWIDLGPDVVAFRRPGGWTSVTNFGSDPVQLPEGEIRLTSGPLKGGLLASETTAWLERSDRA